MIDFSKNELYKILDAVKAYHDDYYVNDSVTRMLKEIQKKVKKEIKEIEFGGQCANCPYIPKWEKGSTKTYTS